jgi:hypothetical protein
LNGSAENAAEAMALDQSLVDAAQVEILAEAERARQAAKSLVVRTAENRFLALCDTLTGLTTHVKLSFEAITTILAAMPPEQSIVLSLQLLAIDAELKREAGLQWWDDCAWHPELA